MYIFLFSLVFLLHLYKTYSSTTVLAIKPEKTKLTIYSGSYHNDATGGVIVAGGSNWMQIKSNPDFIIPYKGFPSKSDTGEIPCGITLNENRWSCGERYNFTSDLILTYDDFIEEMPFYEDFYQFGDYDFDIYLPSILWRKVEVPISKCSRNTKYFISTTADTCTDRPAINNWIEYECDLSKKTSEKQFKGQISLKELQDLPKKIEDKGMYGIKEYIDQIIMEVLIAKTNIVNKKVIKLIKPAKGIILYGPPGTGKTTMAKDLALILGDEKRTKMITSTEVMSKWAGETEANIRALFADAIQSYERLGEDAPLHFLIIDEIDGILSHRGENAGSSFRDAYVNQFLGLMDGLSDSPNIIVIGITNRLDNIDKACLRPGRFGCKIHVDLPSYKQRVEIIKKYYQKVFESGIIERLFSNDISKLSTLTDNYSGADIEYIFDTSIKEYIVRIFDEKERKITKNDLINIINKYKK